MAIKTYNEIATKQDKAFHARARVTLGHKLYESLIDKAKEEFKKAWESSSEIQRENNARRAANLVFRTEMTRVENENNSRKW